MFILKPDINFTTAIHAFLKTFSVKICYIFVGSDYRKFDTW